MSDVGIQTRPDIAEIHGSPPLCPKCSVAMKFSRMYPHPHHPEVDEYFYFCHCGENLTQLVARD